MTIIARQALVGLWKALRHDIRRYPTMTLNGRRKFAGWDAIDAAPARLRELIPAPSSPRPC